MAIFARCEVDMHTMIRICIWGPRTWLHECFNVGRRFRSAGGQLRPPHEKWGLSGEGNAHVELHFTPASGTGIVVPQAEPGIPFNPDPVLFELFAGIGGATIAARPTGMPTAVICEHDIQAIQIWKRNAQGQNPKIWKNFEDHNE